MESNNKALLKKETDRIMKIKGKTASSEYLTLARYIEKKYWKVGLKKLEKKLEELGYPLDFNKIKSGYWYLEAHNVLAMIIARELFGWPDLFDLGYNSPVFSFWGKSFYEAGLFKKSLPGS